MAKSSKESVSGDLTSTRLVDEKKLKPRFGSRKIETVLDPETYEWSVNYYGKVVRGKVQQQTIDDLVAMGVIPQRDDEKFYDSLKLFITRAFLESTNLCSKELDWDDEEEV